MPKILAIAALLASLALFSTASAETLEITPRDTSPTAVDPLVWGEANVRASGAVAITSAAPRGPGARGSLQLNTVAPVVSGQDKADFEIFWDDPNTTLGRLTSLGMDWNRDSSSTVNGILAPVIRLYFETTGGEQGLLIWEATYQDAYPGAVPEDTWVMEDAIAGYFWMRAFGPGRTVDAYGVDLPTWIASGVISDGVDDAWELDADTRIVGLNVGFGSGWGGGDFLAYVDSIRIGFGGGETSYDFEPYGLPCPTTPAPGCTVATPGGAKIVMRHNPAKPARDRMVFDLRSSAATDIADFGDPTTGTHYQLCVWSDDGGGPLLAIEPYASAGANWRGSQRSFRHRDRDSLRGVRRMVLRAGPADRARLRLIGKGAALNLPALPLAGGNDVTAQLHATGGACWEASFSAPRRNDARIYNARSD